MKRQAAFGIVILVIFSACLIGCAGSQGPTPKEQRARATRNLGEAYMAEENYTRALRELLKAEDMTPDDPYVHNDLGLTYLAKNNPEKAVEHFKRAVELNPDYSAARNNLGSAYVSLGKWDRAIECFEEVSKDLLYMTPHYPLSNLGYVYYMRGEYQKAENYYRQSLDMKRDFPKALHGLGLVYLANGDLRKAVKKLELAVEKAPTAASFYLDLGRAYTRNHNYNKALQTYKKAAAIAGDTELADKAEEKAREVMEMY